MRKIAAIFLALALIMAVAVACGKDGDEVTTTAPIATQYVPTTQPTTQPSTNNSAYVLTTQTGQTAPWAETTRFEFTEPTTPAPIPVQTTGSPDYNISFNVSDIQKPNVNTSVAPSTSYVASSGTTKGTETTADKSAEAVSLIVNSYAYGDGVIYVEVDPSNWDGNFAGATQNITIKVNGSPLASSAACTVPAKKTGSIYEIKITVPSQSVNPGDVVSFTIPTGIVKNQSGSQYNLSYSSSVTV